MLSNKNRKMEDLIKKWQLDFEANIKAINYLDQEIARCKNASKVLQEFVESNKAVIEKYHLLKKDKENSSRLMQEAEQRKALIQREYERKTDYLKRGLEAPTTTTPHTSTTLLSIAPESAPKRVKDYEPSEQEERNDGPNELEEAVQKEQEDESQNEQDDESGHVM